MNAITAFEGEDDGLKPCAILSDDFMVNAETASSSIFYNTHAGAVGMLSTKPNQF